MNRRAGPRSLPRIGPSCSPRGTATQRGRTRRSLAEVLKRLQTQYAQEGKADLFAALNPCLVGERTSQPYAELAKKMGVSEGTVKSAVHRLRQRYRQLLRDEIAQTVAGPGEVEEELRHLFAVLAGR